MSDSISVTIEYEKVEITILQPDFIQVNLLEPTILLSVSLNTAHRLLISGNPHVVTKTEIGVDNVTNDAQLKRSGGDFYSFPTKAVLVGDDAILIEDSANNNNKKLVLFSYILDFFNLVYALIGKVTPHVTPLLNATATFTASSTDNTITVDADCNFAYNGFSGSQNISTTQVTIIGTVSITLIGFDVALDSKINLSNMSPGIYHVVAKSYDSGATGYVWASQAA